MRKIIFPILFAFSFLLLILYQIGCSRNEENKELTGEELIERGEFLVEFGGCHDCHSPKNMTDMGPMPDSTLALSGHPAGTQLPPIDTSVINSKWYYGSLDLTAWAGPWGVSYAANLTPDGPTGLGNWTEEIFIKAMRSGKHMGFGRQILPPMPWFNLANLPEEDLRAIFSYLKSIKPIKNQVPPPVPPNMVAQTFNTQK